MSDWPVGLSTGCFYRQSIFDCLEVIRRGGFNVIEVCSFPAHLDYHDRRLVARAARRVEELGLEAYSFHAPFADSIDISAPEPQVRKNALEEIFRAAEAAAFFPVRYFVIHPGPESGEGPGGERFERLKRAADGLNAVAECCHELGIGCVLENKLPHLLFAHPNDLLWILATMQTIGVGVCLDTGHAHLSGDLYGVMHKLGPHLRMVHAHDNRGKGDDHLPPGAGVIDWDRVLADLEATRFRGDLILELAGSADQEGVLAQARQARQFLSEIGRPQALAGPPRA